MDGAGASPEEGGVYMLAAQDVFARLRSMPDLTLAVSMFEIYGQKVRDLLDGNKELMALEDGKGVLQLVGLTGEVYSCRPFSFLRFIFIPSHNTSFPFSPYKSSYFLFSIPFWWAE